MDAEQIVVVEDVPGSDVPVRLMYIELWDGVYAPIGLRVPSGEGPFPVVLMASGNGGGGMAWIRDAIANRGYTMDQILQRGWAVAWIRYREEVELGYNNGGPMVLDNRQGRALRNRSPLEYEDEIAIIEHIKTLPEIDGDKVGLIGMSHGGEMILKLTSEYHGVCAAVASEPASHEYLALNPDNTVFVNEETQLRNIEEMQMGEVEKVRARIDMDIAQSRIAGIDTPILVHGRDDDHLQGIFRTSYELLHEAGKDVEWISYDHDLHGFIYPMRGADGEYEVNDVQHAAIGETLDWLAGHLEG